MANPHDRQGSKSLSKTDMDPLQYIRDTWGGGKCPESEGYTEQPGERSIPRINRECVYS
jgi:hypothetical protein